MDIRKLCESVNGTLTVEEEVETCTVTSERAFSKAVEALEKKGWSGNFSLILRGRNKEKAVVSRGGELTVYGKVRGKPIPDELEGTTLFENTSEETVADGVRATLTATLRIEYDPEKASTIPVAEVRATAPAKPRLLRALLEKVESQLKEYGDAADALKSLL